MWLGSFCLILCCAVVSLTVALLELGVLHWTLPLSFRFASTSIVTRSMHAGTLPSLSVMLNSWIIRVRFELCTCGVVCTCVVKQDSCVLGPHRNLGS